MTSVAVVSAGLGVPSSTRLLAERLAASVAQTVADAEIVHVELREVAHELTDHLLTGFPGPGLDAAFHAVASADAVIAVTPVFSASYSGLFKTFFDVLDEGTLDGTPVLVAATAGTARHSLVLEHALRPLFTYLHAVVVPTGVFAATEDFGHSGLDARVARAAGELAALLGAGPTGTQAARRTTEDELTDPTPFETLLRQVGTG